MTPRANLLEQIIEEARAQKALGRPLKAIFDLDSTVFDVSPRISQILNEYGAIEDIQKKFPAQASVLQSVQPHAGDYGIRRTLVRYNVEIPSEEFFKDIMVFWRSRFFSSPYLKYDTVYPGAYEFVTDLYNAGGDIFYLTGRDIPRMYDGTVEVLKKFGFPLDPDHANLVLKPSKEEEDGKFKRDFFLKMEKTTAPVWFFENEPLNIHMVLEHCPHIRNVFVDTVHSETYPVPPTHVPRLSWI